MRKKLYIRSIPIILSLILLSVVSKAQQVPVITSFSPTSGPIGTTITLAGTNLKNIAINNSDKIIVTVKFNAAPSFANFTYPNLKYEKHSMINFEWDDASTGSIKALPILSAKYFTDGAGNNKPYTLAVAVNGRAQYDNRIVGEHAVWGVVYDEMRQIINSGGDIENHAQYHDLTLSSSNFPIDKTIGAAANLKLLDDQLFGALGYKMNAMVVPSAYPGYMQAAKDMGYAVGTSTGTFDGITHYPQWTPTGSLNLIPSDDSYVAFGRVFTDTWDTAIAEYKTFVDNILTGTSPTVNRFFRVGSHNLNEQGAFVDFINYLSAQANDRIWVTTMREFAEYRITKFRTLSTQVLQGNTLTITLDQSAIGDRVRWRDLSLKINSDAGIESVTVNGATSSYNKTTKLINVFKQKLNFGVQAAEEIPVETLEIGGVAANIISNSGTEIIATLMQGAVTGPVKLTTQGGTATASGTFTVTTPVSTVSTLSSLALNEGTLSPVFSSGNFNYTASVPNTVSVISLKPTTSSAAATVKINGVTVVSGNQSADIPLTVGTNTITTLVTAQDNSTTSTYTLAITRSPSSSAALSSLTLSSGTLSPTFAAATTSYTASVPNDVSSITLIPVTAANAMSITINDVTIASGDTSASIPLAVGKNTLSVKVTAEDNITTSTYTIEIRRAPSSAAALLSLALSSGTLSPTFAAGTTSYTASVPNDVSSIKLIPKSAANTMSITVNGELVSSGNTSAAIPLIVGTNIINTVVTSQDKTTTTTYTITLSRPPLSVAALTGLILSSGALSPAFSTGIMSYTASVANDVNSIMLSPFHNGNNASIQVNSEAIASGGTSAAIPLTVGPNTISIIVTAEDNISTNIYTLVVTRAPSSAATLSSLTLSSGTLSPAFASGTTSYTATVSNEVSSIVLSPASAANAMSIKVNGETLSPGVKSSAIPLAVGLNTISIIVTAEDNISTNTYTLVITRAPSSAATLSSLTLSSGTLSPAFASGTTSYTATVSNEVSSIVLSPVSAANATSIKVNGETLSAGANSTAIPLAVGPNTISTVVTAQDNITTNTYILVVTRVPSSAAALSSLTLSSGTLLPTFTSGTTSYTASVPNNVNSIKLIPVSSTSTMSISVNGENLIAGASTFPIALAVGNTTIRTVVTAEDKITSTTYSLTVNRAPATLPLISSFTPTAAKGGATVTLIGSNFDGTTGVYFGEIPASSFSVKSSTEIMAEVGNGASGNIRVSTPSGTAALAGFTYVYSLPVSNFRISSTGESCINSNDGSINITAEEPLNYTAIITGINFTKTQAFRDAVEFSGLASGTYSVCITVEGKSGYKQCYEVAISKPKSLELYVAVNNSALKNTITLNMKGGTNYKVVLNGVYYTTNRDQITLPVSEGRNVLKVTTDNQCQGVIEKVIDINSSVILYPNPVVDILNLDVGGTLAETAKINIRNMAGKIVFSGRFNISEGKVIINLQELEPAIYYLRLSLGDSESVYKILKK